MKTITTITDVDFFPETQQDTPIPFDIRESVRVVIFNEKNRLVS